MSKVRPSIIVDSREDSFIKESLKALGLDVIEKSITPADYVISRDYAVERKTFRDFMSSIYDGRIFDQGERIAQAYSHPIIIIEGDVEAGLSMVSNPKVFWGALAKVTADHGASIMFTFDKQNTVMFLHSLAIKLSESGVKRLIARHKPRVYTLRERQLLAVQSLPNIGPERAKRLLEKFKTVRRTLTASNTELISLEGFGKRMVEQINELLDTMYPGLDHY